MDCEKYLELMSAALDGECSAEERRELDSHLAVCPRCAALFEILSGQSAALRELDCEVPDGLTGRIMESLPEQKKPGKVIHWRRWGALAACLVLVAAVGILAPRGMRMGSAAPMAPNNYAEPRDGASGIQSYGDPISGAAEAPDAAAPESTGSDTAPSLQPLAPGTASFSGAEPSSCEFENPQTIRVRYGATPAPSALVIGSAEELAGYLARFGSLAYDGDGNPLPIAALEALAETYTGEFFESRRLLCVVVEARSGSNRYELADQGLTRDSVTVRVTVPEIGTDDMAAWLLVAEVDDQFQSGDTLEVVFTR